MQTEVEDFLSPMVTDTETSIEVAGLAALALGMVFVGTAEDGCVEAILQVCWHPASHLLSPSSLCPPA